MPELPEVEITCRGIAPHVEKQCITGMTVHQAKLRWPVPTQILKKNLINQLILKVSRRAKYILIQLPTGFVVIHLGMSGTLRIDDLNTPTRKHDHIEWALSGGTVLRFNDPRRFGSVLWTPALDKLKQLQSLGVEPLSAACTGNYLLRQAKKLRCNIKTFIMNHEIVVGVGNIYANESLFSAGIHPLTLAKDVSKKKFEQLNDAIQTILSEAILHGGTTLKDFYQSNGKPGYFRHKLKVYARAGKPCFKCQTTIQTLRIGQRSTYFCSRCQKITKK